MSLNKNVLHVSTDNKFIEGAKSTFKNIFDKNTFLILRSPFIKLKFAKKDKDTLFWSFYKFNFSLISKFFENYDYIVIHDMNLFNSRLVLTFPQYNYLYIHWGYEIHSNIFIQKKYKELRYKRVVESKRVKPFQLILNFLKYGILKIDFDINKDIYHAINEIKYIHLFDNEYKKFKQIGLLNNRCQLLPKFTYYTCSNNIIEFKKKSNTIIVGNCSIRGINHLEIFKRIKSLKFDKVIAPLSYGSQRYAVEVESLGSSIFKDSFLPIKSFLSISEYKKLFEEASFFVDDSIRQRAFGNILICLELGIKIYLNYKNPIYEFLISKGVFVFKTINIEDKQMQPLSAQQISFNIKFVKENYSRNGIANNWTTFFIDNPIH